MTETNAAEEFNNAINFALEGADENGYGLTDQEGMDFLRMWREGDWDGIREAFPTFKSEMMSQ